MLRVVSGDLLSAPERVIAQGCNCRGAMGRGIALGMRRRYPKMYELYRTLCHRGEFRPGMVWLYYASDGKVIANLATQDTWGTHQVQARPEWIEQSARKLLQWCSDHGESAVAIPKLGCSLGGLSWELVRPLLERVAQEFPAVAVTVYDVRGEI